MQLIIPNNANMLKPLLISVLFMLSVMEINATCKESRDVLPFKTSNAYVLF